MAEVGERRSEVVNINQHKTKLKLVGTAKAESGNQHNRKAKVES